MIAIGMYVISVYLIFFNIIHTRVSQRTVYELRRDLEEKNESLADFLL